MPADADTRYVVRRLNWQADGERVDDHLPGWRPGAPGPAYFEEYEDDRDPDDPRAVLKRAGWYTPEKSGEPFDARVEEGRRALARRARAWRFVRLPGAVPVAAFDTPEEAEADRLAREEAVRRYVNPFRCGFGLADQTTLPEFALKDWLMDEGIRPAKGDSWARVRWDKWWDDNSPKWTDRERRRVWAGVDRIRFFEVVARPAGAEAFVVVQPVASGDEYGLYFRPESASDGGRPRRAFRRPADAEAYRQLLPDEDPNREGATFVRVLARRPLGAWELPPQSGYDRAPELAEIDLPPGGPGRVFVVCRAALYLKRGQFYFDREVWRPGDGWYDGEDQLVPEAGFFTRAEAEVFAAEREAAARRMLNPFRLHAPFRPWPRPWRAPLSAFGPGLEKCRDPDQFAAWWDRHVAPLPDGPFHEAWALFDRLEFYHVVELELED